MNSAQLRHEMRAAMTPVFSARAKPRRPGVYLVAFAKDRTPVVFSYWTGRAWSLPAGTVRQAWRCRGFESHNQQRPWQGLVRH